MKKNFPFKKKKSKTKYYLVSFILFLSFGFLYWNFYRGVDLQKSSLAETSSTTYPTLYSDKHITKNAIISDPKLKNSYSISKKSLLSNVISSFKKTEISSYPSKEEDGTWLWTDTLSITPEYRDMIISSAKKNGLNSIYLSIDTYLDIYSMPEGKKREQKQKEFDDILREFISKANDNGIAVDAEAGWRNWAEEGNTYKAFAVLDYVKDFNNKYEENFRGIQYDIEPYMLPDFETNKKNILSNLISLSDQIVSRLEGSDLELTFVIPEFYDGVDGRTPRFVYGAKYTFTFDHLLNVLEKRGGSKIIVMAYRNFIDGIDGAVSVSKDEISRADKRNTKIIIAQELGDIEPKSYTFFGTSKKYYEKHLTEIERNFSEDKSFGGIAAHYINALIELD